MLSSTKALQVGAAILATSLLAGCSGVDEGDECLDSSQIPIAVTGLASATNLQRNRSVDSASAFYLAPVDTGDAITIDDYLLSIRTDTIEAEEPRSARTPLLGWLIGSAYASCAPFQFAPSQRITDIDLVSDTALSDELASGTSFKAVTTIHVVSNNRLDVPSDDAVIRPGETLPLDEFVSDAAPAPVAFGLLLNADVDATREHRFTITYSLEGGDVFTLTTDPVMLAPASTASDEGL